MTELVHVGATFLKKKNFIKAPHTSKRPLPSPNRETMMEERKKNHKVRHAKGCVRLWLCVYVCERGGVEGVYWMMAGRGVVLLHKQTKL